MHKSNTYESRIRLQDKFMELIHNLAFSVFH